jgi:anti-sigma regulatory factor (Ser/Thr protein kinase)
MRPKRAAPPKVEPPATAEPVSGRSELQRLRSISRHQGHRFQALGETLSALRVGTATLRAESAELRLRAAALRAESADWHAAREPHAAPARPGSGVGAREARVLPLGMRAPGDARALVTKLLSDRVPACVLDSARLVLSELVTNSVRHSGLSDGVVGIRIELTPAMVRLEVADRGRAGVIRTRSPDAACSGGFGLQLVESLSELWGLERSRGGGTRVWAQLVRSPATGNGGTPAEPVEGTP